MGRLAAPFAVLLLAFAANCYGFRSCGPTQFSSATTHRGISSGLWSISEKEAEAEAAETSKVRTFPAIDKDNIMGKTMENMKIEEGESMYFGVFKKKGNVSPTGLSMNQVEEGLINIPPEERLRRFYVGDVVMVAVILFYALSSPPTLLTPLLAFPFLSFGLGFSLSGSKGL